MNIDISQEFMDIMPAKLPPVVAREDVYNQLGGIVMPKTLVNADSAGRAPAKAFRVGRKVTYETKALLEWVINTLGVAVEFKRVQAEERREARARLDDVRQRGSHD